MSSQMAPEVLADPIGVVVDLVAAVETTLQRQVIASIVERIAGGRMKQRRLAQALQAKPGVLVDGRSPAPRAVGDLLIELRAAGATTVSSPVCAECGKAMRVIIRRDEDWFCTVCGRPEPRRCAGCGQTKITTTIDRQGRPRCQQCPADDRDPITVLTTLITSQDPSVSSEAVAAAARRVFSRPRSLMRLAWAIEDNPQLLAGEGANAPIPGVLRLIDKLIAAGATAIIPPACPVCDRVVRLHRRLHGRWHCRNCLAKSRAQPCARCGSVKEAAMRDENGKPLCPNCLLNDPANLETCGRCQRRRPVSTRSPDGPLCSSCVPHKTMTCGICGRFAPCVINKATGDPWCFGCKQRWIRCTNCDTAAPLRGGTIDAPLCSLCTRPDANFWRACPACGRPGRIHNGRCSGCTVRQRLRELLSNESGDLPPDREPLYQALAATERPSTIASWLDKSTAPRILRELAGQTLSHQALDDLPPGKTVEHLRSVLVATAILPERDEHLVRLEHWITRTVVDRGDSEQQHLLHRYAVWHLVRRLRERTRGKPVTHGQTVQVRQHVRAAIRFLDWLTDHGHNLATAGRGDLDAWLTSNTTTLRREAGHFLRWARREKLTTLDAPAVRWGGPSRVIDTEERWEQARRLLHDTELKPEDRLAGLLVLLYAQWPSAISRLTTEHVLTNDENVRISLGDEPVILPEPVAALAIQIVHKRRGHAVIGDQAASPWLFPGGQPGRSISAYHLAERLRQLGLKPGQARSTALFQLATDLPAAVLARMLGIHIAVAAAWQRASSGDWTNYAAEISRRTNH